MIPDVASTASGVNGASSGYLQTLETAQENILGNLETLNKGSVDLPVYRAMGAFAAGERYINRVWSASTDGYVDEVRNYLDRATQQFREARALFAELQQQYQSAPTTA